jgi:hypothetical protein
MIYFAQLRSGGPIKIGYAKNAKRRFSQLQIGNSTTLKCLALIAGNEGDERLLHIKFAQDRIRGEWFKPTEQLREYIRALNSDTKGKQSKAEDTEIESPHRIRSLLRSRHAVRISSSGFRCFVRLTQRLNAMVMALLPVRLQRDFAQ